MSDTSKTIPLTNEQKQEWVTALNQVNDAPIPAVSGDASTCANTKVYVVSFDGTWNDRDAVPQGEVPTIPAQLEKELSAHYGPSLQGHYYPGVGTREDQMQAMADGMTGNGAELKAEQAFTDYTAQAKAWIKQDPSVNIEVVVMGFSRGAASARHFMNLVDERGVPADEGRWEWDSSSYGRMHIPGAEHRDYDGNYLRSPGSVHTSALLYDTVATGQENNLKLGIPASTDYVVHLTSKDEQRLTFALTTVEGAQFDTNHLRSLEMSLPGVHSDLGGGYPGGVDVLSKYAGEEVLKKFGLPVSPGAPPLAALNDGMHDSRWAVDYAITPLKEAIHPDRPIRTVPDSPGEDFKILAENQIHVQPVPAELSGTHSYIVELYGEPAGDVGLHTNYPDQVQVNLDTGEIRIHNDIVHTLSKQDIENLEAGKELAFAFGQDVQHTHAMTPCAPQHPSYVPDGTLPPHEASQPEMSMSH